MNRYLLALVVAALDLVTLLPGWWWATPVIALVGGLLLRGGPAYTAIVVGSAIGWAAALVIRSGAEANRIANLVGVIALGDAGQGWLPLVATAVTALGLAATAAWFGGAIRRARVS